VTTKNIPLGWLKR